jgi:hypothetical protein
MSDLTNSKFIQIATDNEGLHALDDQGRVWFFDYHRDRVWRPMSAARDLRDEEERRKKP